MKREHLSADLELLVDLFYADSALLGRFQNVGPTEMPLGYQTLLAHQNHMTVTVEHFHGCAVNVRVLATVVDGDRYSRKILLTRQTDGAVAQFGLVQIDTRVLSPAVRAAVESQRAPLGRILIENNVLREVHLTHLWRVTAGDDLAALFRVSPGVVTYGRTAIIDCNHEPAIRLLEIVAPLEA